MTSELLPTTFNLFLSKASFLTAKRITESAWTEHLPFAFWLTEQAKPKLFVELGVHWGMSYFAFCQSVKANNLITQCYGVDTWAGDEHSGLYSEEIWLDVNGYNTKEYASFSTLLRTTFKDALSYFESNTIDLLHIDGYHTYEAVKEDFECWLPKVSTNGIIVFHDILVREREFGVYKLWTELKEQYKTFEFLHGHGLGILALGKTPSPILNALFDITDENEISRIRTAYVELGSRHLDKLKVQALEKEIKKLSAMQQHSTMQFLHAKQEYDQLKEESRRIKEQLQHALLEYDHLRIKYEQACKDLDYSRAQYDYAKVEYEQLKIQSDVSRFKREQLEIKVEEDKEAYKQLKNDHDYLRAQYDYAKAEYEQLITENRELKQP